MSSTAFPQRAAALVSLVGLLAAATSTSAQPAASLAVFRVFLTNGQALPILGESAVTGDRLVFTMPIGHPIESAPLQLVTLPLAVVDLDRTHAYATSIRAAHYAATRGDADYAAMTAEVEKSIAALLQIPSQRERLRVAEAAKQRLLQWSRDHYHYRAADIRRLADLFDDVIVELRAAAGEDRFSFELDAEPATPIEPLLPAPDHREVLTLALAAASATGDPAGRTAILTAVAGEVARTEGLEDLGEETARRLAAEQAVDAAYADLTRSIEAAVSRAVSRGDAAAVASLVDDLVARDRALGGARPAEVEAWRTWLDERLETARRHRLALDGYRAVRATLLQYERTVRPAMTSLDALQETLAAVRDARGPAVERLTRAAVRLDRVVAELSAIAAPPAVADIHATLVSVAHLARQAVQRRTAAIATVSETLTAEASAAASGALLLAAQARAQLIARLFPPRVR